MARAITDITNSKNDQPSTYPRGYVVDAQGSEAGSTVGEPMVGDMLQFFAKLMADATITPNSNPDNETNGYQIFQAFINYVRNVLVATETAKGTVEKATTAERDAGTADKYIDAALLKAMTATTSRTGIVEKATTAERNAGASDKYIDAALLNGATLGMLTKIVNIGSWNMQTTSFLEVAHGISDFTKIREVKVLIMADAGTFYKNIELYGSTDVTIESANIEMSRTTGSLFNSTLYSSTSVNRGYIVIKYLP